MMLFYGFGQFDQARREGIWSWSKFFFSLGFALFEAALISVPLLVMNANSPRFWPVYIAP